jgi:hypothetical protein
VSRPAFELAGIFRQHGARYRHTHRLPLRQLRVMRAIELCRTAALGGHLDCCQQCRHTHISYNSCRNRHCPKCQGRERAQWLADRQAELLPVEYFHVVFTVPEAVAQIAFHNPEIVYAILFRAASQTLLTVAADPQHLGATLGFFAVLHTWGQNLLHHPHLHCVIPGGGLSPDRTRWISCRPGFFLPVRVLSRLFRRLFVEALEQALGKGDLHLPPESAPLQALFLTDWVVYAKPPFGGPARAVQYLGRYTHRVAISNERLLAVDAETVTFQWKDYRHKHKHKSRVMTLQAGEFIRRFLIHALPAGFQRIRSYGFLANRHRHANLQLCRRLLASPLTDLLPQPPPCRESQHAPVARPRLCPHCGAAALLRLALLPPYRWPMRPPDSS